MEERMGSQVQDVRDLIRESRETMINGYHSMIRSSYLMNGCCYAMEIGGILQLGYAVSHPKEILLGLPGIMLYIGGRIFNDGVNNHRRVCKEHLSELEKDEGAIRGK